MELNKNYLESWFNLSAIYIKEKEYKKALDILLETNKNNSNNTEILNRIGDIYNNLLLNPKEAIPYYEKSLELNPNNIKIISAIPSENLIYYGYSYFFFP